VIHAKPTDTKNRLRFAKILLSLSDTSPATGLVAGLSDPKQGLSIEETAGALTIEGVAKTLEGDKTAMKTIQKAIRLEPWNQKHWQAAAMCGKQEDDRS
jgi:arginine/lysine/ornithine decarboxylase